MATPQMAVSMEPATGQSIECWLKQAISVSGTGSLFRSTHSQAFSKEPLLILTCSQTVSADPLRMTGSQIVSAEPAMIAYGITDPEAGFRLREPQVLDWTKNLHDLDVVTAMILPGIRELTEPEQRNLRGIYQKLYRKA